MTYVEDVYHLYNCKIVMAMYYKLTFYGMGLGRYLYYFQPNK